MRNENDFFQYIKDIEQRLRVLERNQKAPIGSEVGVDVSAFNGILSASDNTTQKALDKLDDALSGAIQVFSGTLETQLTGLKTITTRHITSGLTNGGNRITVTQSGKYLVHAQQLIATGASAIYFAIRKNGVVQNHAWMNASKQEDAIVDTILDCVAGDYIEVYITNSASTVWNGSHSDLSIFKITQGMKGDRGMSWKGPWSGATAYSVDDAVSYNGASYICIAGHTNQVPPNATYWQELSNGTAADTVDGYHANATPTASNLLVLGAGGKIPSAAYGGDSAWTAPTMQNSWVSFDGGVAHMAPAYRKDALGFVHLQGLIKSGTVGSAAFTLPAGYRPSTSDSGPKLVLGVLSNGAAGRIDLMANGQVIPTSPSVNAWVQLDGIVFLAEH